MRGRWSARPGRLVLAGTFGDVAPHHHPAVQVTVGLDGPMAVAVGDGRTVRCRAVVIASGVRHALLPVAAPTALSVYVNPVARTGVALNALARRGAAGVWPVEPVESVVRAVAGALGTEDLQTVADVAIGELLGAAGVGPAAASPVHPAVQRAVEVLSARVPERADLAAVARAVGVSPDHLGRLFKKQAGTSLSAATRWARLLTALHHLERGASITDAAHLAGFADGAHAHRVCRELVGVAPREVAQALAAERTDPYKHS